MNKIKIVSLGGLNENGKNTYVVEIDGKIFIFDCGLKYANDTMYGIDYIIPDYSYLEKNKDKIVGIFLTHAHPENMGGVNDLCELLPNVKVYCTKYTKKYLELDGFKGNIYEIQAHKKITFGTNCLLSWDILIMDTDFHYITNPKGEIINKPLPITIGNHVWIGCRNTILKGVSIADNVIVSANSTLTKNITESNCIVGGNGSNIRIIKHGVSWHL